MGPETPGHETTYSDLSGKVDLKKSNSRTYKRKEI